MDIDKEVQRELDHNDAVKKAPRKPRPSEIAAKKAKAAAKRKPKKKAQKAKRPKLKKSVKKAVKAKRPASKRKAKKAAKRKPVKWSAERAERMDVRLSKAQKRKLVAKAKAKGRTITSLILDAVDKLR